MLLSNFADMISDIPLRCFGAALEEILLWILPAANCQMAQVLPRKRVCVLVQVR